MANSVTFKAKGLDVALKQLQGYLKDVTDDCKEAVHDHTEHAADRARELAPVATGNLKDGIETEYSSGGFFGRVKSEARGDHDQYYSFAAEFGTVKMPAQPFLHPALEAERPAFEQRIQEIVSK